MAGEWLERTIGDIADIVGGSTPSTSDPTNFNGDIPWLTPKDLAGFHDRYVTCGERNLSQKGLARCSARLLPAGTILLTTRAPIGYVAIAKNPIATNQGFRNLVLKSGVNDEFVYYWLKAHVEELERHASGSTFRELSGSTLSQIHIRIPPFPEQRAIAHILGTLDDKIELNRRMNETLEAIARAIFKSWFVDFDPVIDNALPAGNPIPSVFGERAARRREMLACAKAEGRHFCFPKDIAHLFPDRFIDSDLGPIPEGWEVVIFDEIVDAKQGKYLPETEIMEIQSGEYIYSVWGGKGIRGYARKKMYDEPVVVLTCRGSNCGLLNIADSKNWITNIAFACKPKIGSVYFIYTYFVHDSFVDFISGSAQPQITYEALRYKQMPYPISERAADLFSSLVLPLFKKISENNYQSRTLGSLRDALLPKLIRGEIRVKDAERFFKERGL